jgi:ATP-dependent Clp protease adaptor protein ClpS
MANSKVVDQVDIDTEILSPGKYKVVFYNDNITPVQFVIALLEHTFNHCNERAKEITLQIHNQGTGIAGIYTHEVAEQKGVEATLISRQNGWPLIIKIEEE